MPGRYVPWRTMAMTGCRVDWVLRDGEEQVNVPGLLD